MNNTVKSWGRRGVKNFSRKDLGENTIEKRKRSEPDHEKISFGGITLSSKVIFIFPKFMKNPMLRVRPLNFGKENGTKNQNFFFHT